MTTDSYIFSWLDGNRGVYNIGKIYDDNMKPNTEGSVTSSLDISINFESSILFGASFNAAKPESYKLFIEAERSDDPTIPNAPGSIGGNALYERALALPSVTNMGYKQEINKWELVKQRIDGEKTNEYSAMPIQIKYTDISQNGTEYELRFFFQKSNADGTYSRIERNIPFDVYADENLTQKLEAKGEYLTYKMSPEDYTDTTPDVNKRKVFKKQFWIVPTGAGWAEGTNSANVKVQTNIYMNNRSLASDYTIFRVIGAGQELKPKLSLE